MSGQKSTITGLPAYHLTEMEGALIRARDGLYAVALIVRDTFDSGQQADKARNAIEWITGQMEDEMGVAFENLESIRFEQTAARPSDEDTA